MPSRLAGRLGSESLAGSAFHSPPQQVPVQARWLHSSLSLTAPSSPGEGHGQSCTDLRGLPGEVLALWITSIHLQKVMLSDRVFMHLPHTPPVWGEWTVRVS